MADFYSPGEAVERSGFSLDTLRYYERIGLLDQVNRDRSGHRRFDEDDLEWLAVLRCLRDTGMPIAQMRRYADLVRAGAETIPERVALLAEHDERVERQLALLRERQAHIRRKLAGYQGQLDTTAKAEGR
jgi:DNA-binding transcriptional MerR regulator